MTEASRNSRGFTLIEIMIVVFILGLLGAIGVPNYVKARAETQKNLCISNLRVIDGAKEQWALISHSAQGEPVDENQVNMLVRKGAPHCPARGVYAYRAVGVPPTCSLAELEGHFLPWDSQETDTQEESTEEEKEKKEKEKKEKEKGKGKGRQK